MFPRKFYNNFKRYFTFKLTWFHSVSNILNGAISKNIFSNSLARASIKYDIYFMMISDVSCSPYLYTLQLATIIQSNSLHSCLF